MKFEFSRQIFQKFPEYQIACRPVGVELLHADGQTDRQTDMTKPIFAFRNCVYTRLKRTQPYSDRAGTKTNLEALFTRF